jgi:hypothetical protein
MPAMSRREPFGFPEVAHDHPALALERVEGALVGDEAALTVLQHHDLLPATVVVGPRRSRVLDAQAHWSRQMKWR